MDWDTVREGGGRGFAQVEDKAQRWGDQKYEDTMSMMTNIIHFLLSKSLVNITFYKAEKDNC